MRKTLSIFVIIWSANVMAQGVPADDPFDLSPSASKVEELGIVTQPEVDGLEEQSKELFNAGNCEDAVPVLSEYSKKANWLANMVTATLAPYYSASRDEREGYSYSQVQALVPLETLANDYKGKRNIAFAMQGECLMKLGDQERAIPMLLKALDLLSLDEEAWWERTRDNLFTIIEVNTP